MLSHIEMPGQPSVQRRPVIPGLRDPLSNGWSCDPGPDGPLLPVEKALVPEQVATLMVLRKGRGHALQLLAANVIAFLAQGTDDGYKFRPRTGVSHCLSKPGQLSGIHHVAASADAQTFNAQGDVPAVPRGGIDVGLVRRLVGREPDV